MAATTDSAHLSAVKPHTSSPERLLALMSEVDLLRALPPQEMHALLPYVDLVHVPGGTRIFSEGEAGDALYLVEDGRVRVRREDGTDLGTEGKGEVFGEIALLTGEPRAATIEAETDLTLLRIKRDDFDRVVQASPSLEQALRAAAARHLAGGVMASADPTERRAWRGTALRALAARRRGLQPWQWAMAVGLALWLAVKVNEVGGWLDVGEYEVALAVVQLVSGLTILQGACEAFVLAVERLAARLRWEGFISGTIGSLVATLPEFVVIAFLVSVEPLAAFVTAAVTIFNNAIAFSIYSFFLPKDHKGRFLMPGSLARAGSEVLIAGSAVALIVGFVMIGFRVELQRSALQGGDLLVLGAVLLAIYAYYTYTLLRYYAEGDEEDHPGHPPDPHDLGHATGRIAIASMFALGVLGSYTGGESIGGFAATALDRLGLPTIPTASALALFAGISEYIIVFKAHRRGELGIALSNVFGGMTQVMFLLLPFSMVAIAIFGFATGSPEYRIPINLETTMLMLLLFPLFYVLLEYLKEDHTLNNLDAASMTGIYALLLYFLLTASA